MASLLEKAKGGIKAFVASMLPNFEKSNIVDDLNSAIKELRITREMLNLSTKDYASTIEGSLPRLISEFRSSDMNVKGDILGSIADIIDARMKEIDDIVEYVEEIYAPVVMRDALDYQKINMLRYVEGISFFNEYTRKLVLVMTNERLENPDLVSVVDKLDREFIADINNIKSFVIMTKALSYKAKDLRKAMDKAAKVSFDPDTHNALLRNNPGLDPLSTGMMPVVGHIVYFVGLQVNLYHARRQELAKEEREKLQIQLLLLRRKADGITDEAELAKLEKQLKYYNNRINKITSKLEDMAED